MFHPHYGTSGIGTSSPSNIFFIGGAIGSMLAGIAWTWGGWPTVCAIAAAFGLVALLVDWIGGLE